MESKRIKIFTRPYAEDLERDVNSFMASLEDIKRVVEIKFIDIADDESKPGAIAIMLVIEET